MPELLQFQKSVLVFVLPKDKIFIKISSTLLLSDRVQLKLETTAVSASLGVNERLFLCSASQVEQLVRDASRIIAVS